MNAQQTNLTGNWGLTQYKHGSHCSIAMWNTFFMPQTKAQAIKWLVYVNAHIILATHAHQTPIIYVYIHSWIRTYRHPHSQPG
jgi:hypothetical protein